MDRLPAATWASARQRGFLRAAMKAMLIWQAGGHLVPTHRFGPAALFDGYEAVPGFS